jgi:hypothetical protein
MSTVLMERISLLKVLTPYQSGNYTVIVRDKYGCTATANRDFTYIDICIPNYFTQTAMVI